MINWHNSMIRPKFKSFVWQHALSYAVVVALAQDPSDRTV